MTGPTDGQGHGVGDAVAHWNELQAQAAEAEALAGADGTRVDQAHGLALLHPRAGQTQRQGRAIHGDASAGADLLRHEGQPADVVFVAVRQDDAAQAVRVGAHVGHVGHEQVHARLILAGKGHARVDQYEVVAVLQERAILADLADPAQGDHLEQTRPARGARGFAGLRGPTPAGRPPRAAPGRLARAVPSSVLAHVSPSSVLLRRGSVPHTPAPYPYRALPCC